MFMIVNVSMLSAWADFFFSNDTYWSFPAIFMFENYILHVKKVRNYNLKFVRCTLSNESCLAEKKKKRLNLHVILRETKFK